MSRTTRDTVHGLLKSVLALNEAELSDQLDTLFELYPLRIVLVSYVSALMVEIGRMWEQGELMVMTEHFASNIIVAKLKAMLHEQNTVPRKGPTVLVACAPYEQHEIGALIISLLLSINKWKVIYLGQCVPVSDVIYALDHMDIHTLAISCSHERNLDSLIAIGNHLNSKPGKKPTYIVGGRLFQYNPDLLQRVPLANSPSFDDIINLIPPEHPGYQDIMVKTSLDKTYALLKEAAQKLKSCSTALDPKNNHNNNLYSNIKNES